MQPILPHYLATVWQATSLLEEATSLLEEATSLLEKATSLLLGRN